MRRGKMYSNLSVMQRTDASSDHQVKQYLKKIMLGLRKNFPNRTFWCTHSLVQCSVNIHTEIYNYHQYLSDTDVNLCSLSHCINAP